MVSEWIDLFKLDKYKNWTIPGPKPSLLPLSGPNHFLCSYISLLFSYFHWVWYTLLILWYTSNSNGVFRFHFDILGLTYILGILHNRRYDEFHTKIKICRTVKNDRTSFKIPFIYDFLSSMCLRRNGKLYQNTKWEKYWAVVYGPEELTENDHVAISSLHS